MLRGLKYIIPKKYSAGLLVLRVVVNRIGMDETVHPAGHR